MRADLLRVYDTQIGPWTLPVLGTDRALVAVTATILAPVGNAVPGGPTGKARTDAWKRAVGGGVRERRGSHRCNPLHHWAITVGFAFYPKAHGNGSFDIENFLKPTLDAVAAGLFDDGPIEAITRWHYDDSNFRHLLVHRLADVETLSEEGAALSIVGWDN